MTVPPHIADGYIPFDEKGIDLTQYSGYPYAEASFATRLYKGYYKATDPSAGPFDDYMNRVGATQRELYWFWEVIIERIYETTFIFPGNLTFHFVDWADVPHDPRLDARTIAATNGTPGDVHIWMAHELADPTSSVYEGRRFWRECLVHEMGHALVLNAPSDAVEMIPPLFGKTMDDWDTGVWATSVNEAFAETWKDCVLDKAARLYDNRTQLSIPREKWTAPVVPDGSLPIWQQPRTGAAIPDNWHRSEFYTVLKALTPNRRYPSSSYFCSLGFSWSMAYCGVAYQIFPYPPLWPYDQGAAEIPGAVRAGDTISGVAR